MLIEVLKHGLREHSARQRIHYITINGVVTDSAVVIMDLDGNLIDRGIVKEDDNNSFKATVRLKDFSYAYDVTVYHKDYQTVRFVHDYPVLNIEQLEDKVI